MTDNGGTHSSVSRRVFIRMPLKILPVELDVARLIKASLIKYKYKNDGVTISVFARIENTDSLISQSIGSD